MSQQTGAKSSLIFGYEANFNDGSSVPNRLLPIATESLKGERNKNQSAVIDGGRNPRAPFAGNKQVSGDISAPVDEIMFGYLLAGLLGLPNTTDDGGGNYTHVFAVNLLDLPSFVFEKRFPDAATFVKYTGVKVSSFAITAGGDGELLATFGVEGAEEHAPTVNSVNASPSSETLNPFQNFEATAYEAGSSTGICVNELQLNANNNLSTDSFCIGGGGVRNSLPEGRLSVDGNLKAIFSDKGLLDKAINNTESSLKLEFVKSAQLSLSIECPEIEYSQNTPAISGPEGLFIELPWQGFHRDDAKASALIFTLKNQHADYSA